MMFRAGEEYPSMSGRVLTYSRNVFVPVTSVCRNRCAYCGFRTPVRDGCLMSPEDVEEVLVKGAQAGCTEALFTFGERPEEEEGFDRELSRYGYSRFLDYIYDLCERSIDTGLLPHTNAGILSYDELALLREVNASMGLMLETTAEVPAHALSPGKDPSVRLQMLEDAGRLQIPFTTGVLLGIGETPEDRDDSLRAIAAVHERFGHIQEVIIQNFCPKPGTQMAAASPVNQDEICTTVQHAREILPPEIAVQVPPNLLDASRIVPCGADDLGGVSPVTVDHINPEHPWPALDNLRSIAGGSELHERLCIYPRFIAMRWYPNRLQPLISRLEKEIRGR